MRTKSFNIVTILNYTFFMLINIAMIYPFWYVLMYSLSDPLLKSFSHHYLTPIGFTLDSYIKVFQQNMVYTGFMNSIIITVVGTVIGLIITKTMAYPISREGLASKKHIFALIMFTMIFNGGTIPTYLVVKAYGLVNNIWALILIPTVSVYNILVMMKFFKNIPGSLIESAKIDGYNDMSILFKIVIPLSKPVIATIALFFAVMYWNSFLGGLIYINDSSKWPLQVVLRQLLTETTSSSTTDMRVSTETVNMATVMVTIAPIMAVYPFLQKYFVKGIMLGAVKG